MLEILGSFWRVSIFDEFLDGSQINTNHEKSGISAVTNAPGTAKRLTTRTSRGSGMVPGGMSGVTGEGTLGEGAENYA